ncbi:MAG TPA: DUF4249 domain-containing protein [Mucilaginibacter sp.]|jgi:hypothetical protein|nr:DUF4249 domain-containing protein [Mucilaginibacter sp.]
MYWRKLLLIGIIVAGCRKPYSPPAISTPAGYLVVEGVIDPGTNLTIIKLSRTVNISSKTTAKTITGAVLTVESDQNGSYPLTDQGNGYYVSSGLNLNTANKYRLRIKTNDGRAYLSDLEPVLITPPIDSVGFNITTAPETGIQVYANTHDANNKIHYFRWDYDETWEFYSKYFSHFISDGFSLLTRQNYQNVSLCYTNDVSSDIILGSSAKLTQDIIYQNPIAFIPSTSEKIESRYSILLREYALTTNAFTFYTNLKKNTEQLGSIFDAQPSEIQGNIHCLTSPAEPVIGYVGVSTVSQRRIYISNTQLPQWKPTYPYDCSLDTAKVGTPDYSNLIVNPGIFYAIDAIGPPLSPSGYLYTTRECADCTIRGSKAPPPFWK